MEDRHLIIPSIYEKFSSTTPTYCNNSNNSNNSYNNANSPSSTLSNNNNNNWNNNSYSRESSPTLEHSTTTNTNSNNNNSNCNGSNYNAYSFFGVFDGHGGVDASQYVKDYLLGNIYAQPSFYTGTIDAIDGVGWLSYCSFVLLCVHAFFFLQCIVCVSVFVLLDSLPDLSDAIVKGAALTDADLLDYAKDENIMNGSTACFGFLENEYDECVI
jgi:hypothetical protein